MAYPPPLTFRSLNDSTLSAFTSFLSGKGVSSELSQNMVIFIPEVFNFIINLFKGFRIPCGYLSTSFFTVVTDSAGRFTDFGGKLLPSGSAPLLGHSVFTGFIVSSGLIVTAAHGVCDFYRPVDGTKGFRMRSRVITDVAGQPLPNLVIVEAVAVDTGTDLALLRLPAEIDGTFFFRLAAPGNVHVGQSVQTFGHPYGLPWDFHSGCVANTYRPGNLSVPNPDEMPREFFTLQVDFVTPPGFSGGPLIAASGEVLSVNQSITNIDEEILKKSYKFVSFSVPVHFINEILYWYFKVGQSRGEKIFVRDDGVGQFHILLVEYAQRMIDPSLDHVLAANEKRVRQGLPE
ncbi:hypothetical protein Vadar_004719 [Vaccinium darrowii]|uniref:Uncharacterized protein n=1 Tax=Vaccinium darrowii TaxID=229202 RepID=A0ACB7XWV9_9ERIC|nr:hypothetical protein Vadar_004719 [Vaccinium darrowii]